jgi:hypothetical protein
MRPKEKVKTQNLAETAMVVHTLQPPALQQQPVNNKSIFALPIKVKAESVRILQRIFPQAVEEYGAKPFH